MQGSNWESQGFNKTIVLQSWDLFNVDYVIIIICTYWVTFWLLERSNIMFINHYYSLHVLNRLSKIIIAPITLVACQMYVHVYIQVCVIVSIT